MLATDLSSITSVMLTQRVYEMRQKERRQLVELLQHLAEVERRRLYLEMGHTSLFKLLRDGLGYSSSSAYRRMIGARLVVRYPVVAAYLRDGRLNLTQLGAIHPVITDDTVEAELAAAVGQTEDYLRAMVAGRQGKPVETSSVRLLQVAPRLDLPLVAAPMVVAPAPSAAAGDRQEPALLLSSVEPAPPPVVEVHELRAVVSKAFIDDFEAVRAALSHQIPDRNIPEVLHECIRVALSVFRKRQVGTGRRVTHAPRAGSRKVPAEVRAQVHARDGGSCAHVADDGQRCGSTYQVELHHVQPFATGGPATVDNIELRCRVHNQHHARQELGERHINRAIVRSRLRDPRFTSGRNWNRPVAPAGATAGRNQTPPSRDATSGRNQHHAPSPGSRPASPER
jgi:5-methylcytosine-specific restriction endonuclease McrA